MRIRFVKIVTLLLALTSIAESTAQLVYSDVDLNLDSFKWYSNAVNVNSGSMIGIGESCVDTCTTFLIFNFRSSSEPNLDFRVLDLEGNVVDDVLVVGENVWILSHHLSSGIFSMHQHNLFNEDFHTSVLDSTYRRSTHAVTLFPVQNYLQAVFVSRSDPTDGTVLSVDTSMNVTFEFPSMDFMIGHFEPELVLIDSSIYLVEKQEFPFDCGLSCDSVKFALVNSNLDASATKIPFTPSFSNSVFLPQISSPGFGKVLNTSFSRSNLPLGPYAFRYSIDNQIMSSVRYIGASPSTPIVYDVQSVFNTNESSNYLEMGYCLDIQNGYNFSGYYSVNSTENRLLEKRVFYDREGSGDPCYEAGSVMIFEGLESNGFGGYLLYGRIEEVQGVSPPCLRRRFVPVCFKLDSEFNLTPYGESVVSFSSAGIREDTCEFIDIKPTWSYVDFSLHCETHVSKIRWVKDTLIGSRHASIISKEDSNGHIVNGSELIIFYKDRVLEFFQDGNWEVNYAMNTLPVYGDTLTMAIPRNSELYDVSSNADYSDVASTFRIVVDGLDNSGPSIPGLLPYSTNAYSFRSIVDSVDRFPLRLDNFNIGIGSQFGLFGQNDLQLGSGCPSQLLCFSTVDGDFDISPGGCAIATPTREQKVSTKRSVLVSNVLAKDGSLLLNEEFETYKVSVFNQIGQRIGSVKSNRRIYLPQVTSGVYNIVVVSEIGKQRYSQQFVVAN